MIVREEIPRCSMFAVVFADRAPLALGEIGAPALPVRLSITRFFEAFLFDIHGVVSLTTFEKLLGGDFNRVAVRIANDEGLSRSGLLDGIHNYAGRYEPCPVCAEILSGSLHIE